MQVFEEAKFALTLGTAILSLIGSQFERGVSENWKKEKNSNHNFKIIKTLTIMSYSFPLKGVLNF